MSRLFKPRSTLEFILDTCSLGKNQLAGVEKLIQDAHTRRPKIFENTRIIIPIQIGTEVRQRIFPDFLAAELQIRGRNNHLEEFYCAHKGDIRIVETDISRAYKFLYAKLAAPIVVENPELVTAITQEANSLIERYRPIIGDCPSIQEADVLSLCAEINNAAQQQEAKHAQSVAKTDSAEISAKEHQKNAAKPIVKLKSLARHGAQFLNGKSLAQRYILQAMYSTDALYKRISPQKEFKNFRKDKGERAIESFLFHERAEKNDNRVTIVLSEDAGARTSIQRLRSQSNNSIFTISSWGLALALKELKLIQNLDEIVSPTVIQEFSKKNRLTPQKIQNGAAITVNHILEPRIERKWAHRLVETVKFGHWKATTREHNTRI